MANCDYTRCVICEGLTNINDGEPVLIFKGKSICESCCIDILPEIYTFGKFSCGGLIHYVFQFMLTTPHNRKNRRSLNKTIFKKLLHKYKFSCVECGSKEKLSIDHIKPVSKGGTDEFNNLQILCKTCNSKKGAKYV